MDIYHNRSCLLLRIDTVLTNSKFILDNICFI